MQTITLSPDLTEALTVEAERSGKTIAELAEEWLRQQYQSRRREQLAAQTQRFWAKHAELYTQYPNQFVAFFNDQVLDHDDDMRQLALRVRSTYGLLPIVIAQVTDAPVIEYHMRSPRLQKPSVS